MNYLLYLKMNQSLLYLIVKRGKLLRACNIVIQPQIIIM